jgi:hypothetical protein
MSPTTARARWIVLWPTETLSHGKRGGDLPHLIAKRPEMLLTGKDPTLYQCCVDEACRTRQYYDERLDPVTPANLLALQAALHSKVNTALPIQCQKYNSLEKL